MLSATNATLTVSTTETTTASSTGRKYLHHVDLIRAITFSLVIFVHCLTATTD
ncbi:MAG TPA: acyltransferase, partial [Williamsia sp.]